MEWKIQFKKKAEKDLNKLPQDYQNKVLAVLAIISKDPFAGKKLDGQLDGLYSYRIGPYRIVYKIYKKYLLIIIIRIGHRQGVYKS